MKKTFVTLVIAMAALTGFNVSAQQQNEQQQTVTEQTEKNCDKFNPFEGIQLTAEQQTKIDAIRKPGGRHHGEACKEQKCNKKQQCDRQSKDGRRERMAEGRRQAWREYLAEVKGVLTTDQYVTFLENIAMNRPVHKHHKKMHDRRHHHGCDCKARAEETAEM